MKLTQKELIIKQSVIDRLKQEQKNDDYEIAHCNADDLLCELLNKVGLQEVVDEFIKVGRWYS